VILALIHAPPLFYFPLNTGALHFRLCEILLLVSMYSLPKTKFMKNVHYQLLISIFMCVSMLAQAQRQQKFITFQGKPGITKKVSELQPSSNAQRAILKKKKIKIYKKENKEKTEET